MGRRWAVGRARSAGIVGRTVAVLAAALVRAASRRGGAERALAPLAYHVVVRNGPVMGSASPDRGRRRGDRPARDRWSRAGAAVAIETADGRQARATVLAVSPSMDLAALRVPPGRLPPVAGEDAPELAAGRRPPRHASTPPCGAACGRRDFALAGRGPGAARGAAGLRPGDRSSSCRGRDSAARRPAARRRGGVSSQRRPRSGPAPSAGGSRRPARVRGATGRGVEAFAPRSGVLRASRSAGFWRLGAVVGGFAGAADPA